MRKEWKRMFWPAKATWFIPFALFAAIPALLAAQVAIDCPLRDQPYSIDTPLLDLLIKPEAKAALEREAPGLTQSYPPRFTKTEPPTFAAIMTPRSMASYKRILPGGLANLDRALRALPITAEDKQARCSRYDIDPPRIVMPKGKPRLLVFEKITGFRDGPSVETAGVALRAMAERNGWALVFTDQGGAFSPDILKQLDAVIWNNVSGDVLTVRQRDAFQTYIENGGGFVGLHGSGGDPVYFWDWYADTLIGARFLGHPEAPQFQEARITIEDRDSGIVSGLGAGWSMTDEWYSFMTNPRARGARVLAALDERSYNPGEALKMGDHPIAWTQCIGSGRSFYSAIGHRPETYSDSRHVALLERAIAWAAGEGETRCRGVP
jgi:type 1 glutamine amidotransferase